MTRNQTVREALDQKRKQRKGDVIGLVLCKGELFYLPNRGSAPEDSVYPVSMGVAQKEAKFFKVDLQEA